LLSYRNLTTGHKAAAGFSLVELLIVIVLIGIMSTAMFTFFKSSLFGYLNLQKTASNFTDLASQSQRIAGVVRGTTQLIDAQDNSLEMYAYFYPTDAYVSKVKYYLNATSTLLYADVTPMTANPPIGTEITASKKTYTIIPSFKQLTGVKLFEYLNSASTTLAPPISDLFSVKTVRINLGAVTSSTNGNQVMTIEVSLRNKKTNL
jgi:prepilin-type N-terminal cleavage/methylation domain-containing protein